MRWMEHQVNMHIGQSPGLFKDCVLINEIRERTVQLLSCSRHYIRTFSTDSRLTIMEPIELSKLEAFLAGENFSCIDGIHPDYMVYMTKHLSRDPVFLKRFLETRTNEPCSFNSDFIVVVPKVGEMIINGSSADLIDHIQPPFDLKENALFKGDLGAMEKDEIMLSGRSSRCLDLLSRKLSASGFHTGSLYTRTSTKKQFPFPYYPIMSNFRISGITSVILMLKLVAYSLRDMVFGGDTTWTLEGFNYVNRTLLLSVEFGAVAIRLSKLMTDGYFHELLSLFLETSISWISWLALFDAPQIPAHMVNRWTVSAFDMFIPLIYVHEFRLREFLTKEQIKALESALERLDLKKRRFESLNGTISNVEHMSQFKWKRMNFAMTSFITDDKEKLKPFKCEPLNVRFLSPFEEFVSTPLEKALAPFHCQLVEKIYTGPNASLYKCVDLNSGNLVAVKEFYTLEHSHFESDPESSGSSSSSSSSGSGTGETSTESLSYESSALKAALKEAEILKAVQGHPHVVQLITCSYEKRYFFMFTEFCIGGTLASNKVLCRRSPMSSDTDLIWKARFKVCRQVKEALVHIHELGIVHGDIKPSNVLFDGLGQVRVGDFGNSEYFPRQPFASVPLCLEPSPKTIENFTIPYMAPELLHRPLATAESDMWAFGCFVLEIATGVPPWHGLEATEILLKLASRASPIDHASDRLEGVPPRFMNVIKLCLCPEPTLRPSARDLLESHYL